MKYDLTQDAITKKPNFFPRGSKSVVTLDEAKDITKDYFRQCYDFNTKLKEYMFIEMIIYIGINNKRSVNQL